MNDFIMGILSSTPVACRISARAAWQASI